MQRGSGQEYRCPSTRDKKKKTVVVCTLTCNDRRHLFAKLSQHNIRRCLTKVFFKKYLLSISQPTGHLSATALKQPCKQTQHKWEDEIASPPPPRGAK